MSLPRRTLGAALSSLGTVSATGADAARVIGRAASIPLRLLTLLDRVVGDLDEIAKGVHAMNAEFVGMRVDIRVLDERVEGLRQEMAGFRADVAPPVADVTPMFKSVEALSERVDALAGQLESVEALALRFGRFGRPRSRQRVRGEEQNGEGLRVQDVPTATETTVEATES